MTSLPPVQKLGIMRPEELGRQLGIKVNDLNRLYGQIDDLHYHMTKVQPNGKSRELEPPYDHLKAVQKCIKDLLLRQKLPDYFMGGLPGRSARDNATAHLGQQFVQPLDLQKFFPSITHRQVYEALTTTCGCSPDVARILTRLTTYKGHVPQGSPTSCIIAAIVLVPTANRIKKLADKEGWRFTIFVDDLTLSGPLWIEHFKPTMIRWLKEGGFRPHAASSPKARGMHRRHEQSVTGYKVNGAQPAVTRKHRGKLFSTLNRLKTSEKATGQMPTKKEVNGLLGLARYVSTIESNLAKGVLYDSAVRRWKTKHGCT